MVERDIRVLKLALNASLEQLATSHDASLAAALRPLVLNNLRIGRVHCYLDDSLHRAPADYVQRVLHFYLAEHDYVRSLLADRAEDLWQSLFDEISCWVYLLLLRHHFDASAATRALTNEYATEAAIAMLSAYFPYDVTFKAWAYVLVRNVVCKQLRLATRSQPPEGLLPLDEELQAYRQIQCDEDRRVFELRYDLIDAVQAMPSPLRQQIIFMRYFRSYSLPEIAAELGKPITTIYQEHHKSRQELRSIMGYNGEQNE